MDGTSVVKDLMDGVRQSAMLANVTLSMWSGEKSDKKAMEEVKNRNNAKGDVGRLVKKLLAGADDQLKDVRSAFTAIRMEHYAMTLPWVSDPTAERQRGARLLPVVFYDDYLKRLATARYAAVQQLDAFITIYPDLVARARTNLGGLADLVYPSPDEVRQAFGIKVDLEPIPEAAGFHGLPQQTIDRLGMLLNKKHQAMVSCASQAMWTAVRDRVGHMGETLGDPEARFKVSTIEHVKDLLTYLPGWNLTGDDRVTEIVADIEALMRGVTPEILRSDAAVRASVASQAKSVIEKLQGWGV
jgi:hypothetical protein